MSSKTEIKYVGCQQEVAMFDAMVRAIHTGEQVKLWTEATYTTQAIIEACMESMRSDGADVLIKSPFLPVQFSI